jgi:hypothetical protein
MELTNNQLPWKEMLTDITRNHSLHDNLVSSGFGYEAFAVTREDPLYSRLTTPHSIFLSGNTLNHIRCKMSLCHAPVLGGDRVDTH